MPSCRSMMPCCMRSWTSSTPSASPQPRPAPAASRCVGWGLGCGCGCGCVGLGLGLGLGLALGLRLIVWSDAESRYAEPCGSRSVSHLPQTGGLCSAHCTSRPQVHICDCCGKRVRDGRQLKVVHAEPSFRQVNSASGSRQTNACNIISRANLVSCRRNPASALPALHLSALLSQCIARAGGARLY